MSSAVPAVAQEIGILLSHRCQARCSICCFHCGPCHSGVMTSMQVAEYVDQIAAVPSIHTVVFTGGEPFLFPGLLIEAVSHSSRRGLRVKAATNCFWASGPSEALTVLEQLSHSGLTILEITTDQYHQRYVPSDHVRHAIHAANHLRIEVHLACVVTRTSRKLADILNDLTDVQIDKTAEFTCLPVGRARDVIPREEFLFSDRMPQTRCDLLRIPAIDPSGVLYACCGVAGFLPALALGQPSQTGIKTLLDTAADQPLILALALGGPARVASIMAGQGHEVPAGPFVDQCHLCHDLLIGSNGARAKEAADTHALSLMIERELAVAEPRTVPPPVGLPFRDG